MRRTVGVLCSAQMDPFSVLGLSPAATQPQLRQRYLGLVKEVHPDRPGGQVDLMRDINIAYKLALAMTGKSHNRKPQHTEIKPDEVQTTARRAHRLRGVLDRDVQKSAPLQVIRRHIEGYDMVSNIKKGLILLGSQGGYEGLFVTVLKVNKKEVRLLVLNKNDSPGYKNLPPHTTQGCGGPQDYDTSTFLLSPSGEIVTDPLLQDIYSGCRLLAGYLSLDPMGLEDQIRSHFWRLLPYEKSESVLRTPSSEMLETWRREAYELEYTMKGPV
eukprot:TRINITY_DN5131_c1_g1_i1.p1 TRINITY_DN5131_c1_g1~~TRINITY_DN5131_c1_g1_i1.p1  ORF type:complete len:289 (+),score=54.91 TRINITY_DN5131_c1_g1_i1:56-868(+)